MHRQWMDLKLQNLFLNIKSLKSASQHAFREVEKKRCHSISLHKIKDICIDLRWRCLQHYYFLISKRLCSVTKQKKREEKSFSVNEKNLRKDCKKEVKKKIFYFVEIHFPLHFFFSLVFITLRLVHFKFYVIHLHFNWLVFQLLTPTGNHI